MKDKENTEKSPSPKDIPVVGEVPQKECNSQQTEAWANFFRQMFFKKMGQNQKGHQKGP